MTDMQMQEIAPSFYLADERFEKPGVYWWDGKNNVHVVNEIERLRAELDALKTQLHLAPQPAFPEVLFDGYAVYQELGKAQARTSLENVSDVLDAVVRLIRTAAGRRQMIKYKTKFGTIEAHEVLRETEKMVVLAAHPGGETKELKVCDWYSWHDSWEGAHAHLMAKAQREVDLARMRLESANGKLGNIKGMKKPGDAQ